LIRISFQKNIKLYGKKVDLTLHCTSLCINMICGRAINYDIFSMKRTFDKRLIGKKQKRLSLSPHDELEDLSFSGNEKIRKVIKFRT
jgi:hypothetical protein